MTITLYKCNCEPEYVNKTPYLSSPLEMNGNFRDESDALNPQILIEFNDIPTIAIMPDYNYMYIPVLERWYYITDMRMVRTGLWSIAGHVDVLHTYQNQIKLNHAIIARQEFLYNLDIMDTKLVVDSGRVYQTKAFTGRVLPALNNENSASFVLTIAGGEGT